MPGPIVNTVVLFGVLGLKLLLFPGLKVLGNTFIEVFLFLFVLFVLFVLDSQFSTELPRIKPILFFSRDSPFKQNLFIK